MTTKIETPELDRQAEARKQGSQEIGEFIEWLGTKGYQIGRYRDDLTDTEVCMGYTRRGTPASALALDPANCDGGMVLHDFHLHGEPYETGDACPRCDGTGYIEHPVREQFVPEGKSIEDWLAEYFEIDRNKIEAERRALLDALRSGT